MTRMTACATDKLSTRAVHKLVRHCF